MSEAESQREGSADVWADIKSEHAVQAAKWGAAHDNQHSSDDWMRLFQERQWAMEYVSTAELRRQIVILAALAASAIEAIDRWPAERRVPQ